MKDTIFDQLGIANLERIHSQMIAWIFNLEEKSLSHQDKVKVLCDLSEVTPFDAPKILAETEWEKIDLKVTAGNHLFLIENKVKSSEHDRQSEKYKGIITRPECSGRTIRFIFLSLVGEIPCAENWQVRSHKDLLNSLKKVDVRTGKEQIFFAEYLATLQNLTGALDSFLEDPGKYFWVFASGGWKKSQKAILANSGIEGYIVRNQLETIFQKAFFTKVMTGFKDSDFPDYHIAETRGNALIQIYWKEVFETACFKFRIGLQIQRGVVKINLSAENYMKSRAEKIPQGVIDLFKEMFNSNEDKRVFRFNRPRTKAYLSFSKPWRWEKKEMTVQNFQRKISEELKQLRKKILAHKENLGFA